MKAMRAHQFGGPEQLRLEDVADVGSELHEDRGLRELLRPAGDLLEQLRLLADRTESIRNLHVEIGSLLRDMEPNKSDGVLWLLWRYGD